MNSLNKKVDLFCHRHPRFGIPNLMLYIVIGNAVVWLFSLFAPEILAYLTFSPYEILHGEVWRLVTFIIYPVSTGYLAIIAFYFYYWIGTTLERQWGTGRFTIFLLTGIVLTIVYCFAVYFVTALRLPAELPAEIREIALRSASFPASATYIYFSLFFAFATLFPDMRVLLFFIIPIKMKWLALVDALFFVYEIISNCAAGYVLYGLLPVVALLNYFLFCGGWILDWLRPARRQQRKTTVSFRQEVQRIQSEQKAKPYTRKCEVCGRTDTDYPELEFRYCSRCAGYHCFCIDHINDHQHFTE